MVKKIFKKVYLIVHTRDYFPRLFSIELLKILY